MEQRYPDSCELRIGRYEVFALLGAGGMATVHFGRAADLMGLSRVVAIKRLHRHYANNSEAASMFFDEAHVAMLVRHPNVVATLDTVAEAGEFLLVMEYIAGESIESLQRACTKRGERMPLPIAIRIATDALRGLEAAHQATDPAGEPLHIVHRDVSPHNILVGVDGVSRLLDFGIARAASHLHTTRDGQLKGKLRYMAPEQVLDRGVSAATDVYGLSVVLWEILTGERLFSATNDGALLARILESVVVNPTRIVPEVPQDIGDILMRGLEREASRRFASAREMREALEATATPASAHEVSEWVRRIAASSIAKRAKYVGWLEHGGMNTPAFTSDDDSSDKARFTLTNGIAAMASEAAPASAPAPGTSSPRFLARRKAGALVAALSILIGCALVLLSATQKIPMTSAPTMQTSGIKPASRETTSESQIAVASDPIPAISAALPLVARAPPSASPPAGTHKQVNGSISAPRRGPADAKKAACSPPYYEDPAGIRRIKAGCL